MAKYGITPKGLNIKRLDTIINEFNDELSEGWNVNTRLNPKSYLNVQMTSISDKFAELWELGEHLYHSKYPWSAEGINLDNAVQYGGISREGPKATIYPIHTECIDGTTIPSGTRIRTDTNPAVEFATRTTDIVSRSSFNRATVRVVAVQPTGIYTIALNGAIYSYTSRQSDPKIPVTETDIINGLLNVLSDDNFSVTANGNLLTIKSIDPGRRHIAV